MQRSPMTATIALLAVLSIGGRPNWERGGVRPRDHLLAVHPNMVQPRRAASCSGSSSSPSSARQQRRCAYSGGTRSRSILAQDFGDAVQLDLDGDGGVGANGLLPFVANVTQLRPTTRLPQVAISPFL